MKCLASHGWNLWHLLQLASFVQRPAPVSGACKSEEAKDWIIRLCMMQIWQSRWLVGLEADPEIRLIKTADIS